MNGKVVKIKVEDGDAPRLVFDIEIYNERENKIVFLNTVSEVRTAEGMKKIVRIGSLAPESAFMHVERKNQRKETFYLELDGWTINKIEDLRTKDALFRIDMSALFMDVSDDWKPLKFGWESIPIAHGDSNIIKISKSDWSEEFLPTLGYGRYLLIELPVDIEELAREVKKVERKGLGLRIIEAEKKLEESICEIRRGEWHTAVNKARDIFELLRKGTIEENISVKQVIKNLILSKEFPKDSAESIGMLVDNLSNFTSAAHHVVDKDGKEVTIQASFEKEDALFAVGSAALLLNLLMRKLK